MIGIYSFLENNTGKRYIGYSDNIKRRYSEHLTKTNSRIPFDTILQSKGIENFTFEILEECNINELSEKEKYYIQLYNSKIPNGYNYSDGGDGFHGEDNGRSILTESDIIAIRMAYNQHLRKREVYKQYQNLIAFGTFEHVWEGKTWIYIMPEVYTEENKLYYSKQATNGELSSNAILSDEEVNSLRQQYVDQTAKELYNNYKNRIAYQTFQAILWGRTYKHLPIYKKKEKRWITND